MKEDLKTLSKDVIDKFKTSTEAQLKELSSRCIVGANFASDGKCLPVKTCNYPLEYEKVRTCSSLIWPGLGADQPRHAPTGSANAHACMRLLVALCHACQWLTRACCGVPQSPPTSQSDRVCTKPTACKDTQFESTPLAMKSDRKCSTRKTCTKTQWLKGRGGPTTDDTCADVTTCKSGGAEFETVKPTATSDRACKKTTACTSTEKEVKKPTTTSDRVCAPNHPAGTPPCETPLPRVGSRRAAMIVSAARSADSRLTVDRPRLLDTRADTCVRSRVHMSARLRSHACTCLPLALCTRHCCPFVQAHPKAILCRWVLAKSSKLSCRKRRAGGNMSRRRAVGSSRFGATKRLPAVVGC